MARQNRATFLGMQPIWEKQRPRGCVRKFSSPELLVCFHCGHEMFNRSIYFRLLAFFSLPFAMKSVGSTNRAVQLSKSDGRKGGALMNEKAKRMMLVTKWYRLGLALVVVKPPKRWAFAYNLGHRTAALRAGS
jgi:hypothetical protein